MKTKAADKHKVAAAIFKALGKVVAEPRAGRTHLERVCVRWLGDTDHTVRLEATDGTRAIRLDVREDFLPYVIMPGRYDPKKAAALLGLGQMPAPEHDESAWPDFDACIPERGDKARSPQHYDPALLGETLATVAALTTALQGHKKPRATRLQLEEEVTPCRVDVSGEGWSTVAVVMPMRE